MSKASGKTTSESSSPSLRLPTPVVRPHPYERLRDALLAGELEPGTPLVEASLALWFNVSRTPIREALSRLEQDGLIARDRGRLVVRERSVDEILDIYETRILLESAVARVAAERRTSQDIRVLHMQLDRWDNQQPESVLDILRMNRDFHQAVWRASHNESLIDLLARLDLHVTRFSATTLAHPGRWEQAGEEHRQLVRALEVRDGNGAAEIARQHFQAAREIRLALWAAR